MSQNVKRYRNRNKSYKDDKTSTIRTVFYARVSTKHEEQANALENQLEWCKNLRLEHPNWVIPEELKEIEGIYVDKGITGTQAKKRTNFLRAIKDGKNGLYDLLVVRDVSRFARNCVDSLDYTHELKKHGVEIFYSTDGIWSLDADGDLRLGIMSILAQDESRKISEKVKVGQTISRKNGIIYGTGNILGYEKINDPKDHSKSTYKIIPEDAETIRRIFDLYVNEDMGIKKISTIMTEEHRKNASGIVRWDAGKISRILDNRTYASFVGYNKSICTDFLDHTRVKNKKEDIEYKKGNFPAIIDDELWQKAQAKKKKNSMIVNTKIKEGAKREQEEIVRGKKPAKDKWVKKLKCSCTGCSYKKYKWRTNAETGEDCFGYQCTNIVLHRKKSYHLALGLSGEGLCDVPSIPMWKLDFQLQLILERIWKNPDKTISNLIKTIDENYIDYDEKAAEMENAKLLREESRLKARADRLLESMLDGIISKEKYVEAQADINIKLDEIKAEIDELTGRDNLIKETADRESIIAEIREALEETTELDTKFIDAELVDSIVERIVPYEDGTYKWYLNFTESTADGFDEKDFADYGSFDISFEQARAYRKKFGNFIRANQWKCIHTEIYIRVA